METTIRVSNVVKDRLDKEILLEDNLELNDKTKREIKEARERVKKGKFYIQEEVEKRLGI